jgi:hypothetical protein
MKLFRAPCLLWVDAVEKVFSGSRARIIGGCAQRRPFFSDGWCIVAGALSTLKKA